jgi:hypothetical protein
LIGQKEARRLAIAITYTLLSACGGGGDDDPAQNVSATPGVDGGAPIVGAQPGGSSTTNPPGSTQTNPGTPGAGTGGGSTTPGAMSMGTQDAGTPMPTGPVDLGQNSAGDSFFRADTLVLKAPNLYATLLILRTDVTADGQNALNAALANDDDKDGFVDMSLLLRFLNTKDPKTGSGQVTPGGAACAAPLAAEPACGPEQTFPFQTPPVAFANATQACGLTGAMESAPPPCFHTTPASLTMQLPILGAVPLQDGEVIGTWDGANIANGYVRGFLPKTVAMATKLGDGLPEFLILAGIQKGAPLSNFLNDSQLAKNARGEDGWWFLLSFTAKPAKFTPAP